MRVRVVLAIALLLVAGALVLDMSGRAPRIAATDHTEASAFVAALKSGQELCQPEMVLPSEAKRLRVLVGTFGRPVPELTTRFLAGGDRTIASGTLAGGARQGYVLIPIGYPHGAAAAGTLCIRAVGGHRTVLGGGAFTAGPTSEQIDGVPQAGRIDVVYLRPGSESWWQLLPTLARRFNLGKAPLFGDWTLAVMALLLLGVWVAAVRLLARELR